MRHGIPQSHPASSHDPTRSALAWYDCLELALLSLDDRGFEEFDRQKNLEAWASGQAPADPILARFFDLKRRQRAQRP